MRSAYLTAGSLVLSAAVIGNAYYQKKQFYPSVVYITKSNPSMAIMYLQALVMVLLIGELMRKIFFGQLRAAELEHLIDRSWYVVTETCLAFTIFRDDFSPKFVALFTLLLLLKCFHWLIDDRVDYMERSPVITLLFHVRVISLLLILGALDAYFVHLAYNSMITKGASVQLVFGFEYAILLTIVVNIFIKYILHTIDLHSENPWENKAVFLLYTELAIGLMKMVLYFLFVGIMIKIHTFPLFAVRPMYLTMRTFKKAFSDVIMSRRAIHNMNTLYPDVTPEELQNLDNVCIICREEMVTASKKLPCNHIFHTSCLRSWFQRQQTCPTCRMDVLRLPANPNRHGAPIGGNAPAGQRGNEGGDANSQPPQQPNQPPPQVNIPGMLPNAAPGMFQFWMPPVPPNFPLGPAGAAAGSSSQQPTPGTSGVNLSTPGENESISTTPNIQIPPFLNSFPQMIVPPPFFAPFIPPPMPSQDFSGLTAEELRKMEGEELHNITARVNCLKNIQTLLDAAVLQMQQYTQLIVTQRTVTQGAQGEPTPSTSHTPLIATNGPPSPNSSSDLVNNYEAAGASGYTNPKEVDMTVNQDENCDIDDSSLDEREKLRRRRLQKFSESVRENK